LDKGQLRIDIPKSPDPEARQIEIQSASQAAGNTASSGDKSAHD
jgi:hypothetical protein